MGRLRRAHTRTHTHTPYCSQLLSHALHRQHSNLHSAVLYEDVYKRRLRQQHKVIETLQTGRNYRRRMSVSQTVRLLI